VFTVNTKRDPQPLTEAAFETILDELCSCLTEEARSGTIFEKAKDFETRVRHVLSHLLKPFGQTVDFDPAAQIFPDIVVGEFGIEVKFTTNDTWRSVANSVFEGTRSASVQHIYLVFGKYGGDPAVQWDRYENAVIHVRTSHVPRFEVQIRPSESLFSKIGIPYREFRELSIDQRMEHIRKYARGRLKKGERLWWLEDNEESSHSLPIQARLYTTLEQSEKVRLRAEAAVLCPEIVKPSRSKNKYDDATLYLLTHHGVLCHQARDLFSAGSVAMRSDSTRGGNYVRRALKEIEPQMVEAAEYLSDELFVEYWGSAPAKKARLNEWLRKADQLAANKWKPSRHLFLDYQRTLSEEAASKQR
jgi:hypothetical protein